MSDYNDDLHALINALRRENAELRAQLTAARLIFEEFARAERRLIHVANEGADEYVLLPFEKVTAWLDANHGR